MELNIGDVFSHHSHWDRLLKIGHTSSQTGRIYVYATNTPLRHKRSWWVISELVRHLDIWYKPISHSAYCQYQSSHRLYDAIDEKCPCFKAFVDTEHWY